jgi:hypothetical protein
MVSIPTSNSWKKAKGFKKPFFYACGKGIIERDQVATWTEDDPQLVFLHRVDMGDLLKLGIASEMDIMSKALMTNDKPAKDDKSAQQAVAEAVSQSQNYTKMEKMINLVVISGVIEPKLYAVPEHEAARQEGLNYIDEIPWDDRMELFSVIFDTEGLSTFREEQIDGVGNVADVPSVQLPADGSVDVRPDESEGVLLQQGSVLLREESGSGDVGSGSAEPQRQEAGTGS